MIHKVKIICGAKIALTDSTSERIFHRSIDLPQYSYVVSYLLNLFFFREEKIHKKRYHKATKYIFFTSLSRSKNSISFF